MGPMCGCRENREDEPEWSLQYWFHQELGLHPGAYEVHAIFKPPFVTIYGSTFRFIHSGRRILRCNFGPNAAKEVGYYVGTSEIRW